MELNLGALNTLLREKFGNNQAKMASELNISRYQLNTILKHNGKTAGKKVIGAIIVYCDIHNYNFRDYIFLPTIVNKI